MPWRLFYSVPSGGGRGLLFRCSKRFVLYPGCWRLVALVVAHLPELLKTREVLARIGTVSQGEDAVFRQITLELFLLGLV